MQNETSMPARPYSPTLIETGFPFRELSLVLQADRRMSDPAYRVHRWWARRPPGLMRALLLTASADAVTTAENFWETFGSPGRVLEGQVVVDPFAGGGTTLVEAARLGAHVRGGDVDPLAVAVTRYELRPADRQSVASAGAELLEALRSRLQRYYPSADGAPLHYFHVPLVECPGCGQEGALYRSLVLARSSGKLGSVVRDAAINAFCPDCFALQDMRSADRKRIHCCGRYYLLDAGTFEGGMYACPWCGLRSSHQTLQTASTHYQPVAVEETVRESRRQIREISEDDEDALRRARQSWQRCRKNLGMEDRPLPPMSDGRPHSFGITRLHEMFWPRQLLTFALARQWIERASTNETVKSALRLALSNAVTTNNRLCGYAVDYGRIAPLFSVRGYSLPAVTVELNPLHPNAGRGTLQACIDRVAKGGERHVSRHGWSCKSRRVEKCQFDLSTQTGVKFDVSVRSAERPVRISDRNTADICVFDPPYFDFINYDELSQLQRMMMGMPHAGGAPLKPAGHKDGHSFALRLAVCLRRCLEHVRPGYPLSFTYHSAHLQAWEAIGLALDEAKLRVTAVWPVLSDGHMGHHSFPGNCEWDIVVVCRPVEDVAPQVMGASVDAWIQALSPLQVGASDRDNMSHALRVLGSRFASIATEGV